MSGGHAHDEAPRERAGGVDRQAAQQELAGALATSAAARSSASLQRSSRATVSHLQRSAGSRAVAQALAGQGLAVQRHGEGEELPKKEEDASEVQEKTAKAASAASAPEPPPAGVSGAGASETSTASPAPAPAPAPAQEQAPQPQGNAAPPARTRTAEEERTQTEAGRTAGAAYEAAQRLTPGAQSLAGAQSVLQGVFGGVHTIVPGTIEILADQPACSRKYDEVCIRDHVPRPDGSAWQMGDCARDDAAAGVTTEGFAWAGVVYVNGATPLVTATVHEMLHLNTAATFRALVGETINEGTTEFFARKALRDTGVTVPATTAYPDQVRIATDLIALVGEDVMQTAYFSDPQQLVTTFEARGTGTFANLKAVAEALDTAGVAAALVARTAATAPTGP